MSQDVYSYHSISVFEFLWKWRKNIAIVTAISFLAAILFSSPWFIPPKFKSTVIFYPTKVSSLSRGILGEEGYNREDPLAFGEEEEAEQLIQILQSDDIRDILIDRFNLMSHYDIDSTSNRKFTDLYKEYEDNVTFRRTEYMSVEIKVMDTDPKIAALMATDISNLLDSIKNEIQKVNARKAFAVVEQAYLLKETQMKKFNDSLDYLRKLGIFDYKLQTDNISSEYVKSTSTLSREKARLEVLMKNRDKVPDTAIINTQAKIKGAEAQIAVAQQQLDIITKYGGAYTSLSEQLEKETEVLVELREKYKKAKVDVEEFLPVKFTVNTAREAERKSYPVRWLIVLIATLGGLLMSILILVAYENYQFLIEKRNAETKLSA